NPAPRTGVRAARRSGRCNAGAAVLRGGRGLRPGGAGDPVTSGGRGPGAGRAGRRPRRRRVRAHGGGDDLADPGRERRRRGGGGAGGRGVGSADARGRAVDRRSARRRPHRARAGRFRPLANPTRGLDRRAAGGRRARGRHRAPARHDCTRRGEEMMRRTIGTTMVVVLAAAWPADTLGQHVKGVRGSRGWLPAIGEAGTAAAVVEAVRGPEIAETAAQRVAVPVDRSGRARIGGWRPLSVAKWGMLGLTAVAAVYGLSASLEADGLYDRISEICATDASRCEALPEGGYADDEVA